MKKIFLLIILLFQMNFVFGQICVDSRELYSDGGLTVSYCTISKGQEGNCRKWNVTIYIRNSSSNKISIAGSNILLASDYGMFPAAGTCAGSTSYTNASGDVRLAFPGQGLGFVTELIPNYNVSHSFVLYTNNNYPAVSSYITPFIMKMTSSNPQLASNAHTNSENQPNATSNISNNLQEAITKFNSLINQAAQVDQQKATQIQNDIQRALNSNGNTENFKLTIVNNGIRDLENLIARKNTNSTNNSENTNDIQELWKKQTSLIKEIRSLEPDTKVYAYEGNLSDPLDFRIRKIKEDIIYLDNYLEKLKNGASLEKQAQEKAAQEKQEQYNSYIQQGDEAMGKEDYSNAMNSYQNAQSYATTDSERSSAQQKYNQAFEAKKSAERKERIADHQLTDDQENVAYAATAGAAITAMSLMQDTPSEGFTSGKIFIGLNIEQVPLISNNTSSYHTNKSYLETPLTPGFDFGLTLGIANNKKISVYLTPRFSYGLNALTTGTSGSSFEYGGTAMIRGNWNREFPLKLYAEAGYFKRNADFHYDADASAASSGVTSATDDVRDGEYNYSVLRYGGGIMFHQIDDEEEYMVKGGVFFDKPSFFPKETKPVIGFSLQGLYNKLGSLEIYYSPNYFIGGTLLYPSTLEKENKSYFGIKFTRTGKLW